MSAGTTPPQLEAHLRHQLGAWPPTGGDRADVVASPARTLPGWDGVVRPTAYLRTPLGDVLSVPPQHLEAARALTLPGPDAGRLAAVLGVGHDRELIAPDVYRWSDAPADIGDLGDWVEADDPRVPAWLRPFNGGVLLALSTDGAYLGGVGVKTHDDFGEELAVGTAPEARGRGVARRLVATAARDVIARGRIPTYVHEPDNVASAHVAEAAGFPDRGWRLGGLWRPRHSEGGPVAT